MNLVLGGHTDNDLPNIGFVDCIFSDQLILRKHGHSEFEQSLVAKITQATFLKNGYEVALNYGFSCYKKDVSQLMGILELTTVDRKPCAFSNFIKNAEK